MGGAAGVWAIAAGAARRTRKRSVRMAGIVRRWFGVMRDFGGPIGVAAASPSLRPSAER